jgi:hypothetical protein
VDPDHFAAVKAERAGQELARLIPPGTPIFLFGPATVPHLAGLRPPIQPSNHLETLVPLSFPPNASYRSGLWTMDDIEEWLGVGRYESIFPCSSRLRSWINERWACKPMPWAILWRDGLLARVDRYGWQAPAALMLSLLERHYAPAGTVAYHGITLEIYKRR